MRWCLLLLVLCAACQQPDADAPEAPADTTVAAPLDTAAFLDALPALSEGASLALPHPAPDFALATLGGDTLRMADLHGQWVLMNFWATWCAPCLAEIPELAALHSDLHEHGFQVVGVSMDDAGFEVVRPFAERLGIPYPLVVDDGTLAEKYGGVYNLPTTFLVDADGQIINRFVGIFPTAEMRDPLRDMMGLPVE